MLMRNRRGQGRQMMLFFFLFLMLVIGGGIALGVYAFYGAGYDFRQVDSNLLSYQIKSCVLENEVNVDFWLNFYEVCDFKEEAVKENNRIKINVDGTEAFSYGSVEFCGFTEAEGYPKCTISVFRKDEKSFEVVTTSKQRGVIGTE